MRHTQAMRQILHRTTLRSRPGGKPAALLLGAALVIAPGGLVGGHAGLATKSAAIARHVATNTIVVTGKHSGTLKLKDPAKDCAELFDKLPPKKEDVVKLYYFGKLAGISYGEWSFIAAEKGNGTFTQNNIPESKAALLSPYSPTKVIISSNFFSATSGTITIGGKAGSFRFKMTWSDGTTSAHSSASTMTGSWSCPMVETL